MSKSEENAVVAEKVKSSGGNGNKNDTKSLTFKDWKTLKENQCKSKEKAKSNGNRDNSKNGNNIRNAGCNDKNNSYNSFYEPMSNIQGTSSFSINNNGHSGFIPINKFNGVNYYNNNFGVQGNSFQPPNWFNNFNTPNHNFAGNNFKNRFNNSMRLNFTQPRNNFGNICNRPNGSNVSDNINLPENFFSSDGIYRQKDLMQKPLPNNNPFRNERKASEKLEFNKSRYTKIDKKKKKEIKKSSKEKKVNSNTNNVVKNSSDIKTPSKEPEVYVPNPKAKIDGKPYIPKPKIPIGNFELSKEEKKQQWKEYRQAIKPFKNRDFHNAKRVVQRLGKKSPSELDEKQLFRLAKSREIVEAHKARLAEKYGPYGNYIKADESSNNLGELYILNKKPVGNDSGYSNTLNKRFLDNDSLSEIQHLNNLESGRKIIGYKGFKGFVSGGTLDATIKNVGVQ